MVLATPEQEMPRHSIAPQEKEETKCEIAEARGDETRDEHLDLPASTHLLFPQGWLSHRIESSKIETERNSGFRRPKGAVDGPPKCRPQRPSGRIRFGFLLDRSRLPCITLHG